MMTFSQWEPYEQTFYILVKIFFKMMHMKMFAKCQLLCLDLHVLKKHKKTGMLLFGEYSSGCCLLYLELGRAEFQASKVYFGSYLPIDSFTVSFQSKRSQQPALWLARNCNWQPLENHNNFHRKKMHYNLPRIHRHWVSLGLQAAVTSANWKPLYQTPPTAPQLKS